MTKLGIGLAIVLLITGCSLFSTRSPEEPDPSEWTFVPPTSPDIVMENFTNCIKYKNVDNYIDCFAGDSYVFVPSSDAAAMFPSFFDNWKITDERQFFLSLTITLGQYNTINFELQNTKYETMTSDSVTLVADYSLFMNLPNNNYPAEYEGKLLFTLTPATDGLWAISRWQDFPGSNTEDAKQTYSFLKTYFHN